MEKVGLCMLSTPLVFSQMFVTVKERVIQTCNLEGITAFFSQSRTDTASNRSGRKIHIYTCLCKMNSNKPTQNCLIQATLYKSSELLLWQANLAFTRISSSVAFYFYFIYFFLRDVHTFAHLNVLSGCCYRYPHRAQWGGESSNWEKVRKSKWGGDAAEKEGESAYTEWNGENTKRGTIIHLVVSLSRVRECARSEKREWW